MRAGDEVTCRDRQSMFVGRTGVIIEPLTMGEFGVQFNGDGPVYWFKPTELRYADPASEK